MYTVYEDYWVQAPESRKLINQFAKVICCKFLQTLFNKCKYRDKLCGIGLVLSRSTLVVEKASKTFQQTTFVVIGALWVHG